MNEKQPAIPLTEAALQLQTTPLNLLMHIKRGLIDANEIDAVWMVDAESLQTFAKKHDGQKSAEVCSSGCSKAHGCGSNCG